MVSTKDNMSDRLRFVTCSEVSACVLQRDLIMWQAPRLPVDD